MTQSLATRGMGRGTPRATTASGIYAFEAIDGSIKVGRTKSLRVRANGLTAEHGPLRLLAFMPAPEWALPQLERYAHSAMRWWRRRGEWYEPTRWARQLVSEWAAEGELFCPKWLYWLDTATREPLADWRTRAWSEGERPLASLLNERAV